MSMSIYKDFPGIGPWVRRIVAGYLIICLSILTHAAVMVGMPRDKVIETLGQPTGKLQGGGKEILLYPDGLKVEVRNGVVSAVKHLPSNTAGGSTPEARRNQGDAAETGTKVPAGIPAPFVPGITPASKVPVLQVKWADNPYTTEMFSVSVKRGKDRPALHRISGRHAVARTQKALESGADVTAIDSVGRTALHRYAEPRPYPHEAVKQMKLLIEKGADINAEDSFGQTPLHIAVRHSYAQVKYLISAGAKLDSRDHDGRTPLHIAAIEQNTGGRDLLIAAGADSAIADETGTTPADIAREQARWVSRHQVNGALKSLCFGNNRFIASGSFMKSFPVSIDGANWREIPAPENRDLAAVGFVGNGFVGWATHRGAYGSRNGVDWDALDVPETTLYPSAFAVGPERAIAMGKSATVLHSRDGRKWQKLSQGVCADTLGVGWLGNRFVAVNRDGMVFCSQDGLTWGKAKLDLKGLGLKRARCVNGELFVLGYGGLMIRSKNGVDWRQTAIPVTNALNDIVRGKNRYIAVGDKGAILFSEDAETWHLRRQKGAGDFLSVSFGNNTCVVAGRNTLWSSHL